MSTEDACPYCKHHTHGPMSTHIRQAARSCSSGARSAVICWEAFSGKEDVERADWTIREPKKLGYVLRQDPLQDGDDMPESQEGVRNVLNILKNRSNQSLDQLRVKRWVHKASQHAVKNHVDWSPPA